MRSAVKHGSLCSAFARTDAIAIISTVIALGALAWAGIWLVGEQRRIFVCASHLRRLGRAFAEYAAEHRQALPPAVFDADGKNVSWDTQITGYLTPDLVPSDPSARTNQLERIAYLFHCPSDTEPRGGAPPRSYSMPMYDIAKDGWPPDENSTGGLGLYLDAKSLRKARESMPLKTSNYLPAIKTTMVPAPADTALLVERISILNALWQTRYACILSTRQQFDAKTIERASFHYGRMNYLMLDGHVELLLPDEAGGQVVSGDGGVWTIRAGD